METKEQKRAKPTGRCPACNGKGVIRRRNKSSGQSVSKRCVTCRGSGASSGGYSTKG